MRGGELGDLAGVGVAGDADDPPFMVGNRMPVTDHSAALRPVTRGDPPGCTSANIAMASSQPRRPCPRHSSPAV